MRGPSRYFRVKPMTFEYDRNKIFATMKCEFVYVFNSSIIVHPILAGRENSGIDGFPVRPPLLVPCCVKAIYIHVITGIWHDPTTTYLNSALIDTSVWLCKVKKDSTLHYPHVPSTCNVILSIQGKLKSTFCLNQEMKSGLPFPTPYLRRVSNSCGVGSLDRCQNSFWNCLHRWETKGLGAEEW
jgi:hypothetical protein